MSSEPRQQRQLKLVGEDEVQLMESNEIVERKEDGRECVLG